MTLYDYFIASCFLIWRAFQTLIIIPATIIAMMAVGYALDGDSPVKEAVFAIHRWAEVSVRPAAVGNVKITDCSAIDRVNIELSTPQAICKPKFVSIEKFADSTSSKFTMFYLFLVGVSLLGLMLAYPCRKFYGLCAHNKDKAQ